MKIQLPIPVMKKGYKAELSTEIFRIGGYLFQGLRTSGEKQILHCGLIVQIKN